MDYITFLHDTPLDKTLIGGKALALAELKHKFPVPDGFVVTTKSLDYFLKFARVEDILGDNNKILTEESRVNTRERMITADMPEELQENILQAVSAFTFPFVAVRSSGVGEDGEHFSFAGQFDTFLGVKKNDIPKYVKKCWRSLFSSQVNAYSQKATGSVMSMAVLVQEMIDADISGVGFSVHPVTGEDGVVVVESVIGLGESLVQGAVTPDHYVVNKKDLAVKEKIVGEQDKILRLNTSKSGVIEEEVKYKSRGVLNLNDEQIKQIATLVQNVEIFYNKPVDIEWAFAGKKLYLLQTRPVTTTTTY
jgi:pyruvate,water dikinase